MGRLTASVLAGVILILFAVFLTFAGAAFGFECTSDMYAGESFDTPTRTFTPYDRIYVGLNCRNLKPGSYTMHVNWVHRQQGVVRTDRHEFVLSRETGKSVFFWFKLSRRGPLKSAITNQDFYEGHFGDWTVRGFLDNTLVTEESFAISH